MCLFGDVVQELCLLCLEFRDAVVLALHGVHFRFCVLVEGKQLVKIAEELLLHGVDGMVAGAELLCLLLVDVDILRPAGQLLRDVLDLDDSRLQTLPEFVRIRIHVLDVVQELHHALKLIRDALFCGEHPRRAAESGDDALGVLRLHERIFKLVLLAGLRVQCPNLGDLLL